MKSEYHILNGDALLAQLPDSIQGTRIVAREALSDGEVRAGTLNELFELRAHFISTTYPGYAEDDYFRKSATEFEKILSIPDGSDITLWFEDDLFCQVNLWFVSHLLNQAQDDTNIWLVRPQTHTEYGFGGIHPNELLSLLDHRIPISAEILTMLSDLWNAYQEEDQQHMNEIAEQLHSFPFIQNAIHLHIDRVKNNTPEKILKDIITELNTTEFGPVFGEFCKRVPDYGFGDLQVKRMFDGLISEI